MQSMQTETGLKVQKMDDAYTKEASGTPLIRSTLMTSPQPVTTYKTAFILILKKEDGHLPVSRTALVHLTSQHRVNPHIQEHSYIAHL